MTEECKEKYEFIISACLKKEDSDHKVQAKVRVDWQSGDPDSPQEEALDMAIKKWPIGKGFHDHDASPVSGGDVVNLTNGTNPDNGIIVSK